MMITAALTAAITLLIPQQLDQIVKDGTPGVEVHANGHDYPRGIGATKIDEIRDVHFEPHDLLDVAFQHPPSFQPGERWEYSNTNYVVAGLMIQKVTGRPVAEVVGQRVIERAKLKDTYWPKQGERTIRGRHARAYALSDMENPKSKVVDATELDPSWGWAAGAMISTPADVAKFYRTLLDGGLLAKPQLDEMRRTVPIDEKNAAGLGLESIKLSCGGVYWGHGGTIHGWASLGGATDRREAAITLTALPGTTSDQARTFQQMFDVIDTALCRK